MISEKLFNSNSLGLFLSLGCVAHCMLMPVLLASLPEWNLTGLTDPVIHQILAFLGVGIGIWTLVPGWRQHGRSFVLLLAFCGLSIMNYAAFQSADSCCTNSRCTASVTKTEIPKPGDSTFPQFQDVWNALWQHPTPLGAAMLACAHLLNGCCTRSCCNPQLIT